MRNFFLPLLLILSFSASAQTLQYYTEDGKLTSDKSVAKTYSKTITTDSLRANIKVYNIDGTLETEKNYSNLRKRILDGEFKTWFKDGHLASESLYKDGKLEGVFKTYHENEKLKRDDFYKKGKLIKGKCFTKTGADTTYYDFEIHPQFPGGDKAMFKFIRENLKYPKQAQKDKIQGLVVVNFVIDRSGLISETKVLKSIRPDLDDEVVRLVNSMPTWKQAFQDGRKVKMRFTLPVRFTL